MKLVTQRFYVDWNQLSRAKSRQWTIENSHYSSLCNSQQLTQPPLALSVPLSRFTPQVGAGSAFFVRRLDYYMATKLNNMKRASICGWIGCVVGCVSIFSKIVSLYVLTTVGTNPATVPYVLHFLQADVMAFIVGIPLGIYTWILERRGLGAMAIIFCIAAIALDFIHR